MEWYWIVLLTACYFVVIGVSCAIINDKDIDKVTAAFMGVLWPIFLPMFLGYFLVESIRNKKK